MQISQDGIALVKRCETCSLTAYPDPQGQKCDQCNIEVKPDGYCPNCGNPCKGWSCGWGHYGVTPTTVWTQPQADSTLVSDLTWVESEVNRLVIVPLTQGEFDALCSFVYNVGAGNFEESTLLRLLNNKDYSGAAAQFQLWDHAGGKVLADLLKRRQLEEAEFAAGMSLLNTSE
jgi:lysozyme